MSAIVGLEGAFERHKQAGSEAFNSQDFDLAISEYTLAIRVVPESESANSFKAVVFCNRSAAYGALEQYSRALDDAKIALKYDPENVKAYYRIATYSLPLGYWDAAISACEEGLKIDPSNKPLRRLKMKAKEEKKAVSWEQGAVDFYRGVETQNPAVLESAISTLTKSLNVMKEELRENRIDRRDYARRLVFLSYSNIDADRVEKGRELLREAFRLLTPPDASCPDSSAILQSICSELLMTYEEIGDMKSCQDLVSQFILAGLNIYSSPYQRAGHIVRTLEAKPWWDAYGQDSRFRWINDLTSTTNFATIRDEVELLLPDEDYTKIGDGGRMEHDARVLEGDWREVVLFGRGGDTSRAPNTCKLLSDILPPHTLELFRDGGGEIIFSRLNCESKILPHVAPTNHRLTCHLGIFVPPESSGRCEIRVGEEWRRWEAGKAIVFDDSFEHEVVNSSSQARIILLIRFWHPDFSSPHSMSTALREAIELKEKLHKQRWVVPVENQEPGSPW